MPNQRNKTKKSVTVALPEALVDQIDSLVDRGIFRSRTHAMQHFMEQQVGIQKTPKGGKILLTESDRSTTMSEVLGRVESANPTKEKKAG
jgi:hypothetical protein